MTYCLWLYGMPNTGKTTLCYHLLQDKLRNCILIDGDKFREHTNNTDYSKESTIKNNKQTSKLASRLMSEGWNVLVAMITPTLEGRQEAKKVFKEQNQTVIMIKLDCSTPTRQSRPNFRETQIVMEEQGSETDYYLNTEKNNIDTCVNFVNNILTPQK